MSAQKGPVTSEVLAEMLTTNPVVVRRIMAGLRKMGYVQSAKGHGGGWVLACNQSKITLCDIYSALGSPPLLTIDKRTEKPTCLVEQSVNKVLGQLCQDAEELVLSRLGQLTLAMLSADMHLRSMYRGRCRNSHGKIHAS